YQLERPLWTSSISSFNFQPTVKPIKEDFKVPNAVPQQFSVNRSPLAPLQVKMLAPDSVAVIIGVELLKALGWPTSVTTVQVLGYYSSYQSLIPDYVDITTQNGAWCPLSRIARTMGPFSICRGGPLRIFRSGIAQVQC